MTEHDTGFKLQQNGSIDFDAYRAKAAKLRREARDHFVWNMAVPVLWSAPARFLSRTVRGTIHRLILVR